MTELASFWDKKVKKGWKHFSDQMTDEKIEYTIGLFKEHALDKLDKDVGSFIDWGCGGGLLSKAILEFAPDCEGTIVDISQESLDVAETYIDKPITKVVVDENLNNTMVPTDVDLLFCYSVIQHFPSVVYWNEVSKFWNNEVKPKHIAIRTKVEDETKEADNYYEARNFLRGLVLSWNDLLSPFEENYTLVYKHEGATKSNQRDGFVVLKRKD